MSDGDFSHEVPDAEDQFFLINTNISCGVLSVEGVRGVHDIRTRNGGDRIFVEFHLEVEGTLTVDVGHNICDAAEMAVSRLFNVADVTAHLEPEGIEDDRLDDILS